MAHIRALYRYPVKSMLGESLDAVEVTGRGFVGDRVGAVVCDGRIASAKQIRRWAGLLQLAATYGAEGVRVHLPDGSPVAPALLDLALSDHLGREVHYIQERPAVPVADRTPLEPGDPTEFTLGRAAPAGGFFDYAPLHLVATATLDALGGVDPIRFRPNLVHDGHEPRAGDRLRIGDEVELRVITETPRCAVPPLRHGNAAPEPDLLRRLPRTELGRIAGVYAEVVSTGTVRVGDGVEVLAPTAG